MASTRVSVSKLALVGLTQPLAMLVQMVVAATMLVPHPLLSPHFAAKALAATLVPGVVTMTLGAQLMPGRTLALKLAYQLLPIVWVAAYFATPTHAIEVATGAWFLVTAGRDLHGTFRAGAHLAANERTWVEQTLVSGEISLGVNEPCACRPCRARDEAHDALETIAATPPIDDAVVAAAARAYCYAHRRAREAHNDARFAIE